MPSTNKRCNQDMYGQLALKRIGILLETESPAEHLALLVKKHAKAQSDLDIHTQYSVIEDLVIQSLIRKFKDNLLDKYWHLYNVGYFEEDTEIYMKESIKNSS